jgi:hypothetical protein
VRWIGRTAERLLDGELLLLRTLPRGGKSALCEATAAELGPSAYLLSGARFTEADQRELREELERQIVGRVRDYGCAQLIFDDYGKAIRRSQGGQLHSLLYGLLVDGHIARDVGALLTSRFSDDLDLRYAGSPLLSRAEILQPPETTDADAAELGVGTATLHELAGRSTAFARRMVADDGRLESTYGLVEYLNADCGRLADDLPPDVIEVLLGARPPAALSSAGRTILRTFGDCNDAGFRPARAVSEAALLRELSTRSPGWPADRDASVRQFARMLGGVEEAMWVDRYLFALPTELRSFLTELRTRTSTRLLLLGSDDRDIPNFAADACAAVHDIPSVSARMMTWADRRQLHDRHLVLPATRSGYVIPTTGVILGCHEPGSAVAVPMPQLPVNYGDYWRRASRVDR